MPDPILALACLFIGLVVGLALGLGLMVMWQNHSYRPPADYGEPDDVSDWARRAGL